MEIAGFCLSLTQSQQQRTTLGIVYWFLAPQGLERHIIKAHCLSIRRQRHVTLPRPYGIFDRLGCLVLLCRLTVVVRQLSVVLLQAVDKEGLQRHRHAVVQCTALCGEQTPVRHLLRQSVLKEVRYLPRQPTRIEEFGTAQGSEMDRKLPFWEPRKLS